MRVVFDTNVLLVSLPSHSLFRALYQAVVDERLTLYITTEILAEYEEQISRRLGIARTDVQLWELLNLPNVQEITLYYHWYLLAEYRCRRQIRGLCNCLRCGLSSNE